ncbi:MAG: peptidoglycan DD-metalloendopeptidase family protein [Pirellulales bacterium]|nr:peptidoglycan DD-metalloendopeptidase family protein [Pirellulales bacterium]
MRTTYSILALLAAAFLTTMASAEEPAQRFQVVADRMVKAINEQDYPGIQQDFGKVVLDGFPLEKSKPFFKKLVTDCGKIEKLDPPRLIPPDQAIFAVHFERAVLDLKIVLDGEDKITGLWFHPPTPAIPVPEKHATVLRLPFEECWKVAWGGDTKELNQHHDCPNQKFAFDFLVVDEHGKTHANDGTKNEDYYAFGRPVLAPADGVVAEVIDGVRDNTPGSMNPYSAVGNAVIIRHRKHEVSVLAHFQQGTICVKRGERVKQGQVLGLCGNSGNSSEAHIHYHFQNTPILQDGTGIKCYFDRVRVLRDGKTESKKHYSPVRNDLVERTRL